VSYDATRTGIGEGPKSNRPGDGGAAVGDGPTVEPSTMVHIRWEPHFAGGGWAAVIPST
jgi:hypothetical protein